MWGKGLLVKRVTFHSSLDIEALQKRFFTHVENEPSYHFENNVCIPDDLYTKAYAGYWEDNQFALRPIRKRKDRFWQYRIRQKKDSNQPMVKGNVVSQADGTLIQAKLKPQNSLIFGQSAMACGVVLGIMLYKTPADDVPYLVGFVALIALLLYVVGIKGINKNSRAVIRDLADIFAAEPR